MVTGARLRHILRASLILWGLVIGLTAVGRMIPSAQVAFESHRQRESELYLLDVAHGIEVNISRRPRHDDHAPAWSPDGKRLVFQSLPMFTMRFNLQMLYQMDARSRQGAYVAMPANLTVSSPSWSPNGRYIAFAARSTSMRYNDIFAVNVVNGRLTRLSNTPDLPESSPVWSPDGRFIAYVGYDWAAAAPNDVRVVPFVDSVLRLAQQVQLGVQIITEEPFARDPMWTPDGQQLLFILERGTSALYTSDVALNTPDERVNERLLYIEEPELSADGEWLLFATADNRADAWRRLAVMRPDGSGFRYITGVSQISGQRDTAPTWRP